MKNQFEKGYARVLNRTHVMHQVIGFILQITLRLLLRVFCFIARSSLLFITLIKVYHITIAYYFHYGTSIVFFFY